MRRRQRAASGRCLPANWVCRGRVSGSRTARSASRHGELHAEAVQHFEHGVVAGLGARGEGLVEALAGRGRRVRQSRSCRAPRRRGPPQRGRPSGCRPPGLPSETPPRPRRYRENALGSNSVTRIIRADSARAGGLPPRRRGPPPSPPGTAWARARIPRVARTSRSNRQRAVDRSDNAQHRLRGFAPSSPRDRGLTEKPRASPWSGACGAQH